MDEQKILEMVKSSQSWEQILYEIVAWEGLDPWDLNIVALSDGFAKYVTGLHLLDFKIPAKYVMISSVLLRMKTEHMNLLDMLNPPEAEAEEIPAANGVQGPEFAVDPL